MANILCRLVSKPASAVPFAEVNLPVVPREEETLIVSAGSGFEHYKVHEIAYLAINQLKKGVGDSAHEPAVLLIVSKMPY
mgnify:CR=1 FL=1